MTTSESKGRFFLQNESIRITNRIDSNRELECSVCQPHNVENDDTAQDLATGNES